MVAGSPGALALVRAPMRLRAWLATATDGKEQPPKLAVHKIRTHVMALFSEGFFFKIDWPMRNSARRFFEMSRFRAASAGAPREEARHATAPSTPLR
jgi:hypothetical protein